MLKDHLTQEGKIISGENRESGPKEKRGRVMTFRKENEGRKSSFVSKKNFKEFPVNDEHCCPFSEKRYGKDCGKLI